jgi:hypothetical protein
MFGLIEKRLLAAALTAICLLYITARMLPELRWQSLQRPNLAANTAVGSRVNRAKQIEDLFFSKTPLKLKPARSMSSPFFPNPEQPAPPAPPPLTQDIPVLYQGFFQTSGGDRKACVLVGDKTVVGGVNTKITGTYVITEIALASLTIKDSLGKVAVLPFRTAKAVTIPAP